MKSWTRRGGDLRHDSTVDPCDGGESHRTNLEVQARRVGRYVLIPNFPHHLGWCLVVSNPRLNVRMLQALLEGHRVQVPTELPEEVLVFGDELFELFHFLQLKHM